MTVNDPNISRQIIARCLEGDIKAQFMLYKQYSKAMYNIAIRFLSNKMDAEDILQESFVTAFERLSDLSSFNAFGNWLKRIVINNCISHIRRNRIVFEEINDYLLEDESYSEEIDFIIDPAIVHNAIRELPGGARSILILYALEGYRHHEIAEMLGISESTSKTQYKRALTLLNRNLKPRLYVN